MELHINPCMRCELRGCGKHSECDKYMTFYNRGREIAAKRLAENEVSGYARETARKILRRRRIPE